MYQLFYKIKNKQTFFCSTYYSFDKKHNLHMLQFNEGKVGVIHNFDCIITEKENEIFQEYEDIRKKYPDSAPKTKTIELSVNLEEVLGEDIDIENFLVHIWYTLKNIIITSGQSLFNSPCSKIEDLENKHFVKRFEIIDLKSFYNELKTWKKVYKFKDSEVKIRYLN